jgi:hypothetical protein
VTEREPSHADLVKQAAEAMRANGRIPEMPVLRSLPAEALREIIAAHTGPFFVL